MTDQKRRNKYEKYGRICKIHVMAKEIDRTVYEFLRAVPRTAWAKFCIAVGANPPSVDTIDALLKRYQRRFTRKYAEKKPN